MSTSAHGRTVEDGALSCVDCVGGHYCVILFCKANSWRDFNRLIKNCSLCINWEPGVVRFGLWCCGSSNKSFVVLGRGRTVRGTMAMTCMAKILKSRLCGEADSIGAASTI